MVGGSSHVQQSSITSSLSDLPKTLRSNAREALQYMQTALTVDEESTIQSSSAKAFLSIHRLVDSSELHQDADSSKIGMPRNRVLSGDAPSTPSATPNEVTLVSVTMQLSNVVNKALLDVFSDMMDQDSQSRCQLLITFLHALRPILDPKCVVMEWWDVLLRPALKNQYCNVSASRKAQSLVVWAMSATPSSTYVDEQAPTNVWPPAEQSAMVANLRSGRKPGDAPYPASSTRSASQTRSSESGEARASALFATPSKRSTPSDALYRFTQRIFDLYTSEASSDSSRTVDEDETRELELDDDDAEEEASASGTDRDKERRGTADQDLVGPTWKGNLEAIILTFGEERPKPFFHHLSDSFVDPQARIPILLLLTIFFRLSSLHAYHIVSTPLVRLLVLSLQLDTSRTSSSLGVRALVTLIPHLPNWLASGGAGGLPAVLSIFARIVDWRKVLPGWEERSNVLGSASEGNNEEREKVEHLSKRLQLRKGLEWKRLESTYDTSHTSRPNAGMLFTVLYGIFPCNVIRFLRAPIDYLRKAEYESPFQTDWEDIIDEHAVQQKTAPILTRHRLHPALVDMDAEREISDTQRWKDHDPASTTAQCASLSLVGEDLSSHHSNLQNWMEQLRNYSISSSSEGPTFVHGDIPGRRARPRSLSDNLGTADAELVTRAALLDSPQSPHTLISSREGSPSPFPKHNLGAMTPRVPSLVPRRQLHDEHLRLHIALRSGSPLAAGRSGSHAGLVGRSSSMRATSNSTTYRSFHLAQPTLTSVLMSPSRSMDVVPPSSSPAPEQSDRQEPSTPSLSPSQPGELLALLGSPAMSLGPEGSASKRSKLSYLKQENLQLRNELNYEIGQKDQLLRHIGTIHRNRVKDTVLEEELQNLYQSGRSDKLILKSVKDELENVKAEARQSKARQASWQADLTAKLKTIREEKKAWGNEVRLLKIALEDRQELIEKLERQLDENASELFELREVVRQDAQKVEAIHRYEDKLERQESMLRLWNDDMQAFERQNNDVRRLLSRWEEMRMLVEASQAEAASAYSQRYLLEQLNEDLQSRLHDAEQAIDHLTKKQTDKTHERVKSLATAASSSLAREEADRLRLKKRIEELEEQLLNAKVREERSHTPRKDLQDRQPNSPLLAAEHEIAPLDIAANVQERL